MNIQEYQQLASRTLKQEKGTELSILNMALGLAGESGETVDYLKKVLFHGHQFNAEKLASELGDVLWYIAGMCTVLQIDLAAVAQYNIDKLKDRYPEGFNEQDSINRKENNNE